MYKVKKKMATFDWDFDGVIVQALTVRLILAVHFNFFCGIVR